MLCAVCYVLCAVLQIEANPGEFELISPRPYFNRHAKQRTEMEVFPEKFGRFAARPRAACAMFTR